MGGQAPRRARQAAIAVGVTAASWALSFGVRAVHGAVLLGRRR